MLPTPSTSHVSYDRIYEPAEDSYLYLDTLSSASETEWLQARFKPSFDQTSASSLPSTTTTSPLRPGQTPTPITTPPLVVELGPGSGVIIAFLTAHAHTIFGQPVLSLGVDVNPHACLATRTTVEKALYETRTAPESNSTINNSIYLASLTGDLTTPLRPGEVDVLIFNPPYVPTDSVPDFEALRNQNQNQQIHTVPVTSVGADANDTQSNPKLDTKVSSYSSSLTFEESSHLLALSYAGGIDGMQVTMRLLRQIPHILSPRGVAYILFCRGNKPEEVKSWIRSWNDDGSDNSGSDDGRRRWTAETVGSSGKTAGWEKLEIVRICRE
ncbi:hypothetical protein ABEF93_003390 [Exophiala dermatitidis]